MGRQSRERAGGAGLRLELISIHVPKTAGSSFRRILEQAYGEEGALLPLYDREAVAPILDNRVPALDARVRAIHGHFPATPALRAAFPDARIVAWVREPVARIISYYHFWKRMPRHGNPGHDYFLDHDLSPAEFAEHPEIRRELHDYLGRIPLTDFFFIGLMERFQEDVRLLAARMGWPRPEVARENASRGTPEVGARERARIEAAMGEATALYREVKALRGLA